MLQKYGKIACTLLLVVTHLVVFTGNGYAEAPSVKLIINPNRTDVELGAEPIALTAKATGANLRYRWDIKGPGKIDGEGSAVFYVLPKTIKGASEQALVTVTISDASGQETTETVTFNIIAPPKASKPTPAPKAEKKGMSTTTKIALGVGAAAAIGGGVALLAGGDDDEDDEPFTGTFRGTDRSGTSNQGNPYTFYYMLNLKQDGTVLTGTVERNSTLLNCCTNIVTVPVTGNVAGNSANISWGGAEGSCECNWTTWVTTLDADSAHMTLVNGNTLVFDAGAEYVRMKIIPTGSEGEYEPFSCPLDSTFIRQ